MKLQSIISCLEELAPPALQESYDNAGLITGSPEMEITQAMLCLDVTEGVVEQALQKKCNLIIAHHPIIFSGLKKITRQTYVERVIIMAIKNDIAIYSVHTNLDNVHAGVNAKIAERLQLINTRILLPLRGKLMKLFTFVPHDHAMNVRQALFNAGAGRIGNYDETSFNAEGYGTFRGNDQTKPFIGEKGIQHREPETKMEVIFPFYLQKNIIAALLNAHPYEEVAYDIVALENDWHQSGAGIIGELEQPMEAISFLAFLKEKMNTKTIRHSKLETSNLKLQTVSVCGGSGSFLLKEAIVQKADIFITGDFKYHQFFDAEGKIIIADIGHYESEQFTPEIIHDFLKEKLPTFATVSTTVNTNPINYY